MIKYTINLIYGKEYYPSLYGVAIMPKGYKVCTDFFKNAVEVDGES